MNPDLKTLYEDLLALKNKIKSAIDTEKSKRTDEQKDTLKNAQKSIDDLNALIAAEEAEVAYEKSLSENVAKINVKLKDDPVGRPKFPNPEKTESSQKSVDTQEFDFMSDPKLTAQERERHERISHAKSAMISYGDTEIQKKWSTGGFSSVGHFLKAVKDTTLAGSYSDSAKSLSKWIDESNKFISHMAAKGDTILTTDEGSAGILVPEGFSSAINQYRAISGSQDLSTRCRNQSISQPSMTFYRYNDTSRANGRRHAGVTVRWANENEQVTDRTKPDFEKYRIDCEKMICYVNITEEQLADSPYNIGQIVNRLVSEAKWFELSRCIFEGDGVGGKPLGIMNQIYNGTANSGCVVKVSKEASQAASTLTVGNINTMWNRLDPQARAGAIWMINADVQPALDVIEFPVGTGGLPAYLPPGGLSVDGYATLKGRPVVPFEFCETLGTMGDIVLANWDGYQVVTRSGLQSDVSIHIDFDRDRSVYRFKFRVGGQPIYNNPFTPMKSAVKTSNFVVLETRNGS